MIRSLGLALFLILVATSGGAGPAAAPDPSPAAPDLAPAPAAATPPRRIRVTAPIAPTPSLYLVGDSTAAKQTRAATTIQGWGVPFTEFFNPEKIHVVNAALGGRSSRTYITEGHLDELLAKLNPEDVVLLQWGHNDAYDINGPTGRGTLHGLGEETQEIENSLTHRHETVHTFGWYLRQYVTEIRARGAIPVILTLTVRDRWNPDGTIERNPAPDLNLADTNRFHEPPIYSVWSAEVAQELSVPLLDVHDLIADRYDREGPAVVSGYFNSAKDPTHRNPRGAEVDATLTLAALRAYKGPLADRYLSAQGLAIPAAPASFVSANTLAEAAQRAPSQLQPFLFAGSLDEQQDSPETPRTGKIVLGLAGDSTVNYSTGYAAGLRSHLENQLQVINLSRGGRTTATFRSDGRWKQMLALKPDFVMIQFGHNDSGVMTTKVYADNLRRFVDEARAAGIKPILVTPISRRYWKEDGKIHSDLIPYAEALEAVAVEKGVPWMDLHRRSIEFYEQVGKAVTDTWSYPKPNAARLTSEHPETLPAMVLDLTHFNPKGSAAVGPVVADELKRAVPELAPYVH